MISFGNTKESWIVIGRHAGKVFLDTVKTMMLLTTTKLFTCIRVASSMTSLKVLVNMRRVALIVLLIGDLHVSKIPSLDLQYP